MSAFTDLAKLENSRNCLRRIARHDEPQFSKDSIMNVMERFVKSVSVMDDTILVPCRLMDRQVGDSTDIVVPATGKDSTSNQHTLEHSSAHGKHNTVHSKNVNEFLHSAELFNLYNMLNVLKNELLWTGKDHNVADEEDDAGVVVQRPSDEIDAGNYGVRIESDLKAETNAIATDAVNSTNATNTNATTSTTVKGHNRRPSTASVASTVSAVSVSNLSDSESEISNENDSGIEFEAGNKSDNAQSGSSDSSSSGGSVSSAENVRTQKAGNADKATELAKRCKRHLNGLYQCLEQMTEAASYLTARYQSDIGPV